MSFITDLTARLPFGKHVENLEYYFALNIEAEKVSAAVWTIENKCLNIVNCAEAAYSSQEELLSATDKVLDMALGDFIAEPDKILFGVPDSWLSEDNLKEQYLNLLRKIVKELDLKPMAYVSTTQALSHFLENLEGAPTTAILVGIEKENLSVSLIRAGKPGGTKALIRGDNLGIDIEKGLLSFSEIEVLPSKILIYAGEDLEKIKGELLSFPWMQKLSFLHFPKISILEDNVALKATSFAGAVEQNPDVKYHPQTLKPSPISNKQSLLTEDPKVQTSDDLANLGFVAGDVTARVESEEKEEETESGGENLEDGQSVSGRETHTESAGHVPERDVDEIKEENAIVERVSSPFRAMPEMASVLRFKGALLLPLLLLVVVLMSYLFLYKASVMVYLEPKVLEKEAQVTADPTIKAVDEANKKIPGEVVETAVSGSGKGSATGKKQVGDSAKGTVTVYNKTYDKVNLSSGALLSASGQKFTLDTSVNVASQSAVDSGITFGKATVNVTASVIGADGNLPSSTELVVAGYSADKVSAKAEGNFSGGTSKEVTVVTSDDQQKLLAQVSSDLKKQAQQKLQEKQSGKKILEEALREDITKKSYSKNINDQASEFSLNLNARYKGTAYSDADLRTIVSKLVETNVPSDFQLNLAETETQADVSKVEKDGKLIFLAKFKAKLMPKVDSEKIKNEIRARSLLQSENIIKGYDNVLGSEVKTNLPFLPQVLQRMPILTQNINVQTGLK